MIQVFDTPITSNDQSIDRVLSTGKPILLVFLDHPSQSPLEPTLKRIAADHAGAMLVVQIPTRENPSTLQRYQITRIPAVVTINNGQTQSKAELIGPADLEKHAAYLLGKGPKPEAPQPAYRPAAAGPTTTASAPNRPKAVNDATFDQEVLHSAKPVLVDFWAPWCGPCRIVEPTVEKLAQELVGKASIVKVNVDESPLIAQRYGIQSIPTMMVVKNGKIVDRWAGALPEPSLRSRVEPLLRS